MRRVCKQQASRRTREEWKEKRSCGHFSRISLRRAGLTLELLRKLFVVFSQVQAPVPADFEASSFRLFNAFNSAQKLRKLLYSRQED